MDSGSKQISIEEVQFHKHPLISFTRFASGRCKVCNTHDYIYGGYRCNDIGCEEYVFHKECVMPLPEINHSSHPDHALKLFILPDLESYRPNPLYSKHLVGYCCSVCDFKMDLESAKSLVIPYTYEPYQTSHPQHQLKSLFDHPDYADDKCLLCEKYFDGVYRHTHHCDVCNFSICSSCMLNPPPVDVESPKTHEHQLHLVPRLIKFTCNACGEQGDRSPYFCLQCNFMIHWQCIDLPRVININRHDHRISYTRRLGHGEWKCRVCRKKVDGFYGAYTCVKCPTFAVHSLCATRDDVWDMRELEGTPEEEEIPPFEVIDDNTIKHFSHDHNLRISKDGNGRNQPENIVCEACRLQILAEPFYSCKQCHFILHKKCANHPRQKRHVLSNQPFTLHTDSRNEVDRCQFCHQYFTGFRYKTPNHKMLDVRCAAISDTLEHRSHQHPLYFATAFWTCSRCQSGGPKFFKCDECNYILDTPCAFVPEKVMKNRYDDHPLVLYFGDMDVDGEYWCEACETKVNPKEWFYTCNDCKTTLHITCVVGDFSHIMTGSVDHNFPYTNPVYANKEVVSNTSLCRLFCSGCNSRCNLPTIFKISKAGVVVYICSLRCHNRFSYATTLN